MQSRCPGMPGIHVVYVAQGKQTNKQSKWRVGWKWKEVSDGRPMGQAVGKRSRRFLSKRMVQSEVPNQGKLIGQFCLGWKV